MDYQLCERCGRNSGIEIHHIIFRSHLKAMANIKINFKYLCSECHRNSNVSPHRNREVDLQYKRELQEKLIKLFTEEYYTEVKIRKKLDTTQTEVRKLVSKLNVYKEGYKSQDLIFRMMGYKNYES